MSVVNACEVTMQFMSVGFENCLSRSLVLSFWACDLSVSFYTHASISVAHLQEEEVAESGVSGRAFARSVLAHLDMPLFSYLLCFLKLCFFFFSSPLTLLLYQNSRCKLTSDLICWGFPEVRPTRAAKWLLFFWGRQTRHFLAVWKIVL